MAQNEQQRGGDKLYWMGWHAVCTASVNNLPVYDKGTWVEEFLRWVRYFLFIIYAYVSFRVYHAVPGLNHGVPAAEANAAAEGDEMPRPNQDNDA